MAASTEATRRWALPQIRWSAVIAGALLALALHVTLGLIGVAGGLAAEPADSEGLGVGAAIWGLLVPFLATLAGAWLAVRLSGEDDDAGAHVHGVLVWCIGLIAGAIFLTGTGASAALSAGSAASGNVAAARSAIPGTQRGPIAGDAREDVAGRRAAAGTAAAALGALLGLGGAFAGSTLARRAGEGRRGAGWRIGVIREREGHAAATRPTESHVETTGERVITPPPPAPRGPGEPLHH